MTSSPMDRIEVDGNPTEAARVDRPMGNRLWLAATGAVALALVAVSVAGPSERFTSLHPDPLDTVAQFKAAFDSGSPGDLQAMLADQPTIISWPAGPPWAGPRKWTIELVPPTRSPTLDHQAELHDYVEFHQALGGETDLFNCASETPVREPARSSYDHWVTCGFQVTNQLVHALAPDEVGAEGSLRFGVVDGRVSAVIVEEWKTTLRVFDYLIWIRDAKPTAYEDVLAGRLTQPNYTGQSADALLALAHEYAASQGA